MKLLLSLILLLLSPLGLTHEGEDHGAPPPAPAQALGPRTSAASEEFEVVLSVAEKQLLVYVDRYASNEPVSAAKIEIDGAGLKGEAKEVSAGTYAMPLAAPLPAARHGFTVSIETADSADLLSAHLDIAAPTASVMPAAGSTSARWWGGAVLAVLILLTAVWRRRSARGGRA